MRRIETDILVVGGGPAGLSAATSAAGAGARVDLVDAGAAPGGQYWMQDPVAGATTTQSAEGIAAISAARAAGVAIHSGAEVWAAFPGGEIMAHDAEGPVVFQARSIVVASGAQDRVYPFPGWTLPGVMTPGAGQRLAKLGKTAPGKRIALAGNGPFLYAVAATLASIDATPKLLLESGKARAPMLGLLARHPARIAEAVSLLAAARAVPNWRRGHVVTEALGEDRVEAIRIAPVDDAGTVDTARSERIDGIDALLVGWGFRPMIELTALLRCRHAYDRALGGWYCVASPATGLTSVEGVYAAGEVTGIAGSRPARLSGALAGLSAAAGLGFASPGNEERRKRLVRALASARSFGHELGRLAPPPAGIADLANDDTIVCRCENVTRGEIAAALAEGTRAVAGAKMWTRAGMGRCQGRVCGSAVAEIAASLGGTEIAAAGFNPPRIPLRPVPLPAVLEATRAAGTGETH